MLPRQSRFRRGRRNPPPEPAPLTPEENQQQWIACVLDMCRVAASEEHPDYTAAHWTFLRKVLGFTSDEAVQAHRFHNVPLDRETCERIARDWWHCAICDGRIAKSEDNLCPACEEEMADAA